MPSGYSRVALVEHSSTRIRRVAQSTMAEESASWSLAIDRKLYANLSGQHMLYGQSLVSENWYEELIVKDIVVTDAHS
eukprot:4274527-Heterocapsa_arctica.AAC.1